MNFTTWLYGKSNHSKRELALRTIAALDLNVQWSVINQAYFVISSQGNVKRILPTKVEVINYLADF